MRARVGVRVRVRVRVRVSPNPHLTMGRLLGDRGTAATLLLLQVLGHARGGLPGGVELRRLLLAQADLLANGAVPLDHWLC